MDGLSNKPVLKIKVKKPVQRSRFAASTVRAVVNEHGERVLRVLEFNVKTGRSEFREYPMVNKARRRKGPSSSPTRAAAPVVELDTDSAASVLPISSKRSRASMSLLERKGLAQLQIVPDAERCMPECEEVVVDDRSVEAFVTDLMRDFGIDPAGKNLVPLLQCCDSLERFAATSLAENDRLTAVLDVLFTDTPEADDCYLQVLDFLDDKIENGSGNTAANEGLKWHSTLHKRRFKGSTQHFMNQLCQRHDIHSKALRGALAANVYAPILDFIADHSQFLQSFDRYAPSQAKRGNAAFIKAMKTMHLGLQAKRKAVLANTFRLVSDATAVVEVDEFLTSLSRQLFIRQVSTLEGLIAAPHQAARLELFSAYVKQLPLVKKESYLKIPSVCEYVSRLFAECDPSQRVSDENRQLLFKMVSGFSSDKGRYTSRSCMNNLLKSFFNRPDLIIKVNNFIDKQLLSTAHEERFSDGGFEFKHVIHCVYERGRFTELDALSPKAGKRPTAHQDSFTFAKFANLMQRKQCHAMSTKEHAFRKTPKMADAMMPDLVHMAYKQFGTSTFFSEGNSGCFYFRTLLAIYSMP